MRRLARTIFMVTTFLLLGDLILKASRSEEGPTATRDQIFPQGDAEIETKMPSRDVFVQLGTSEAQHLLNAQVDCSKPWMTFDNNGRLGNQLCPIFFLYYVRYTYGAQVGLSPKVWDLVKDIFPHLHVKRLPDKCVQRIEQIPKVNKAVTLHHIRVNQGLKNSIYMYDSNCRVADIHPLRKVLINEFRFSDSIYKEAGERLEGLLAQWRSKQPMQTVSPVLVGVHIRRGDYVSFLKNRANTTLPTSDYFQRAFIRAREMFGVVAFMVVSTDVWWCQEHVVSKNNDAVISSPASPIVDMATLTLCDHVITTVGTYGDSAAILAGGKIFYPYRNFTKEENQYGIQYFKDQLDQYPDFIPVNYDPREI